MKYVNTAIWKHEKPIDEEEERAYMSVLKSILSADDYLLDTIWYKIDDYTHGSVGIYKSKKAYEDFLEANATQREFAAGDRKITMISEHKGSAYALHSEVD